MEIAIMTSKLTARILLPAIAAVVSLFTVAGAASAQQQNAPATMGPGMAPQNQAACQMDQYIDGDLAFLKAELKITEAQAPEWNRFAQAFRSDMEKRASMCREARDKAKEMRSANLLDAVSMAEEQFTQRLESMRAMKAALQPLYASLGKDQRKTADQIMRGGQIF